MIPYFLFGIVSVLIQYAIDVVMHRSLDVPAALLGIVTGQYGFVPVDESGIYWFLFVMFMADTMAYPINLCVNKYRNERNMILWGGYFCL